MPNKPGLYITGICLANKFYPLYVGEAEDLAGRKVRSYLNRHELFDFTNMAAVYQDLQLWNIHWHKNSRPIGATPNHIVNLIMKNKNTLLWINGPDYFIAHFGYSLQASNQTRVVKQLPILPLLHNPGYIHWERRFVRAYQTLNSNFAYSYAILNGPRLQAEADTKRALDNLGYYTHSHVSGYRHGQKPTNTFSCSFNFDCDCRSVHQVGEIAPQAIAN